MRLILAIVALTLATSAEAGSGSAYRTAKTKLYECILDHSYVDNFPTPKDFRRVLKECETQKDFVAFLFMKMFPKHDLKEVRRDIKWLATGMVEATLLTRYLVTRKR